jgi:hypothetical protein
MFGIDPTQARRGFREALEPASNSHLIEMAVWLLPLVVAARAAVPGAKSCGHNVIVS